MNRNIVDIATDRCDRLVLSIHARIAVRLLFIANEMLCTSASSGGLESNDSLVDESTSKVWVVCEPLPVAAAFCYSAQRTDLVLSAGTIRKRKRKATYHRT